MATTYGEMREMLIDAMSMVKEGELDPQKATAMAKLAGQVNAAMKVELEARQTLLKGGAGSGAKELELGALKLGDERTVEL